MMQYDILENSRIPDFSEDRTAFFFRAQAANEERLLDPEYESNKIRRNVGKHSRHSIVFISTSTFISTAV
jgi:hypothetical protein